MGSKTYSNNFIQKDLDPNVSLDREILANFISDPEFLLRVRKVYSILKKSVSEDVIDAIIKIEAKNGRSSDRSDILVFLALMSVMLGDSDYIISRWYELSRYLDMPLEQLKAFMQVYGYFWLVPLTEGSVINDDRQRAFLETFYPMMKNRGTLSSFIAAIVAYNFEDRAYSHVNQISVNEGFDENWSSGVLIQSPYTSLEGKYKGDDFIPTPIYQSNRNAYVQIIMSMLERIRPAGVYLRFPGAQFDLSDFDGGSYWRHYYIKDSAGKYYPWEVIKDTSIVKRIDGAYIEVTEGSNKIPLSENYKNLIISNIISVELPIMDRNNISYSAVADLSYGSGTYANASPYQDKANVRMVNNLGETKPASILYGSSVTYDLSESGSSASAIKFSVIKDWQFNKLCIRRGEFYLLAPLEWEVK